jgi:D-threo-aldose 1-dehydrogenase
MTANRVKPKIQLSPLGFGAATQGGLFQSVSEVEANAVFQTAWDAGIRYFDTAPWYGFGQSELRLGEFLQGKLDYILSSKVGRLLREGISPHPSQLGSDGTPVFKTTTPYNVVYDYSYDGVMRSVEESLERLGVEQIEILFLHDPDVLGLSVKEVMQGGYKALHELREQGLVRAIGAGMNQWQMPLEFAQAGKFDLFLLAGRYTLLDQTSMPFMDYCAEHQIGVVVGGVYNSGLLANPQPGAHYDYGEVPAEVLQRAIRIKAVCERFEIDLKAAAIQFPRAHPVVASVLTAARSVRQLEQNLAAFRQTIPLEFWQVLHQEGLLNEAIPTPLEVSRD